MSTVANKKTDATIQAEVLRELQWDARVSQTDVGVQVKAGIVTLAGLIDSYAKRQAACDAAHRVPGVHDVVNDLKVHLPIPGKRTDPELALAVRRALEWDALVPDEKIQSTVADGWVILEGQVEHAYQQDDAARVVERLNGVRGVTNRIVVRAKAVNADSIRSSIQEALKRQTERESERIAIQVKDGVVQLSGKVRSWVEKRAIEGVARFAPGVQQVENHLVVDMFGG